MVNGLTKPKPKGITFKTSISFYIFTLIIHDTPVHIELLPFASNVLLKTSVKGNNSKRNEIPLCFPSKIDNTYTLTGTG